MYNYRQGGVRDGRMSCGLIQGRLLLRVNRLYAQKAG